MRRSDPRKIRINIFSYTSAREFLADLLKEHKAKRPDFNLRSLAQRAGLKSPGFFKMLADGKRRFTNKTVVALAQAFDLSEKEKKYFEILTRYNQTTNPDEKNALFELINQLRPKSQKFLLKKKYNRYLTHEHYVTIREMILLNDFKEDPEWIAARCAPPITVVQARAALSELIELGLIARDADGKLVQNHGHIKTDDFNTQAIEAYHFHESVLNKTRNALGYFAQEERSFQSLTLSLPKEMVSQITAEYIKFRDWIVDLANQSPKADEVYHVNFQIFPATEKKKSESETT